MDNYKLQQYITVYGRETELAETVFSRFPAQTVFKKNINLKKKKKELFEFTGWNGLFDYMSGQPGKKRNIAQNFDRGIL